MQVARLSLRSILTSALLVLCCSASAQVFDSGGAIPVSLTGTGTLWSSCSLSGYQTIAFEIASNPSGNKVQMQVTQDVAGAGAGTATWLPNSAGQAAINPTESDDATSFSSPIWVIWPKYFQCSRLQVLSGAGTLTGWVKLGGPTTTIVQATWPNQSWLDASVSSLAKSDTIVLANTTGVRQFVQLINTSSVLIWCNYGTSVAAGTGIPLNGLGASSFVSLDGFGLPYGGAVSRNDLHCMTDTGAASLGSLTIKYQGTSS